MKKIFYAVLLIPFFILLLTIPGPSVRADNNDQVKNIVLTKDEVINHDYFAAGNTVNISGIINGDAYVAGGNVTFDGVVNGDLIVAGGNLALSGRVVGNVRAAGGNIVFSSDVYKNATILGGSISAIEPGDIRGSLVSAGGNISVNSPVGKDINVAGGQVILGNSVNGMVNAYTSNLTLNPQAKIKGDLNYWSQKEMTFNPEASISGATNYHFVQTPKYDENKTKAVADKNTILSIITAGSLMFYIISFIASLITGLLLIKLLPVFTANTVMTLETHPWASLAIGFLTIALFPITFIILLITVVGIPLAFVLLTAIFVLGFMSQIFAAIFIGKKLFGNFQKEPNSMDWSLFTGLLVLGILYLIPIINFFTAIFTYLFGIGALLIQKKNTYSLLRQKKLI